MTVVASLVGMQSAFGQATWTAATNGTWGTAANWSTGAVPGAGNNTAAVLTNTSASYTVTYDTAMTGTLASLTLTNIASNTTTLNVNAANFRFTSGTMTNATINIGSGGSMVGTLSSTTGSNVLNINGGLFSTTGNFGNTTAAATITVNISSGTFTSSGNNFGRFNMTGGIANTSGATDQYNGGVISGGTFTNTSSSGMYLRSGTWNVKDTGVFNVGKLLSSGVTAGNLQVDGGTMTVTGDTFGLGTSQSGAATGQFVQSGGSVSMANANGLVIGVSSSTTLTGLYQYQLQGGTLALQKITLASGSYTSITGTNAFRMSGGSLNLGSGGLVTGGGSGTKLIQLSGGAVAATADWSSSLDMSLLTTSGMTVVGTGTATFQAADAGNVARNITLSGILSGSGALAKTGGGVLALQNANTYSGATTVRAGRLQIDAAGAINSTSGITIDGASAELRYNSATPLTRTITFTQGTISGTGTIGTAVTVGTGDILSPGNSPGTQAYTSGLTWAPGGQYTWEINNWSGSAGTNYDQLVVSGSALNVTATTGSTFRVAVTGLTAGDVSGAVPGFSAAATTGTSFTIATSSAGITGFDRSKFTIDTSGFVGSNTLATNAGFWLSASGTSVDLNYAPSATYVLSAGASATAIRVGGSSTITATVASSTAAVTNPDSLVYGGLALSGGVGPLSSTTGTLAPGEAGSGNAVFTGNAAGAVTFTPSVTTATNLNIGTNANAGLTSGVTVSVYNAAAVNTLSGTSFGTVLKGTSLSQTLAITNTAPTGSYTEKLDAAFGTLGGAVTTNSGSVSLLAAGSTSTALTVYLGSGSAGNVSGTAQVNFASNGQGTSGLGTLSLSPQTVSLTATVLDPAVASFTSGSTTTLLLLDFGSVNQNASVSPLGFALFNIEQMPGFTADLALIGIVPGTGNTGAFSTTLSSTFNDLAAGGAPKTYTASFDTSGLGAFTNTYTYRFKSANAGTVYDGDTVQTLSLTVQGVIIVPEPGTAAAASLGIVIAGWAAWRRRRHGSV